MEQYIPKSALLAEIEKLKDDAHNGVLYHQSRQNIGLENELSTWGHLESAFATVLKIINILEVKEVDLEKEIEKEWLNCDLCRENTILEYANIGIKKFRTIAKHFFELGLKVAQKGE